MSTNLHRCPNPSCLSKSHGVFASSRGLSSHLAVSVPCQQHMEAQTQSTCKRMRLTSQFAVNPHVLSHTVLSMPSLACHNVNPCYPSFDQNGYSNSTNMDNNSFLPFHFFLGTVSILYLWLQLDRICLWFQTVAQGEKWDIWCWFWTGNCFLLTQWIHCNLFQFTNTTWFVDFFDFERKIEKKSYYQ